MEDQQTSVVSSSSSDFASSSISRYEGLIDLPFTERVIDSLIGLFNYFDIYAPDIPIIYEIVTVFRFFQLIGGSFMAANLNSFVPGTFTYQVMSIITVFFHLIPLQYRRGNGYIVLYVVNSILLLFLFYLIITAFRYKSTSKVPDISTKLLSIFMAFGPYLLVPISAQYSGQMLSGLIMGTLEVSPKQIVAIVMSIIAIILWIWVIVKSYSIALVFRPCSFQSIESGPQTKLLVTTAVVTFASALTTNLDSYSSAAMMILSVLLYIYCSTTLFNCGTFIKPVHQVMVFSGCIIGMIISAATLYTVFANKPWEPFYFLGVLIISVIVFVCVSLFIKRRIRNELVILDQIDDAQDISILGKFNKFEQILSTGFYYAHPICSSFRLFKLAVAQWHDYLLAWALYAKFLAMYPEQTLQLEFIAHNIANIKTDAKVLQSVVLSSVGYIIKTRETKFTQHLKSRLSKLSKLFNKTNARLRNVWDLTLQANINEMHLAMKRTKDSISDCEVEMQHLLMQYPNNRYVARQYTMFLNEVKGDPILAKASLDNFYKLQRGLTVIEDTIHELGMNSFVNMPELCKEVEGNVKSQNIEQESLGVDENLLDDSVNFEAIESVSKQIENHKVPAIQYIYHTSILMFIFLVFVPLILMIVAYPIFSKQLEEPLEIMKGIASTRDVISILTGYVGRFLFQELDDPYDPSRKINGPLELIDNFDMTAFGGYRETRDIMIYVANSVSDANELLSEVRSFKLGNSYMESIRTMLFTNSINYSFYLNNTYSENTMNSVSDISFMVATQVGKLLEFDVITPEVACGSYSLTARNNNQLSLIRMNSALETMIQYLKTINEKFQVVFLIILFILIGLSVIFYPLVYYLQFTKLQRNRREILLSLTTLPKAVISNISNSFTKIKENNNSISNENSSDIESNRQEDSIIKLFSTISDGSSKASIEVTNFICFMLLIILSCLSYFLVINCYITSSKNVVYNCHHINYLFGSTTYLFSTMASIFKIALAEYHPVFANSIVSLQDEINKIGQRIPMLVTYFQMIRLGGADKKEVPFPQMQETIDEASASLICKNQTKPPTTLMESTHCLTSAQQLYVATTLMNKYYGLMLQKIYPDPSDISLQQVWQIGPIELYATFFYKAGKTLVPIIIEEIDNEHKNQIIYSIVFIVLTLFLTIIIMVNAKNENNLLKFMLRLYLRCPPSYILDNQKIMDLLSGNYTKDKDDDQTENFKWFTNEVVNKLDDVIIVCQEETSKIISVNQTFIDMFGIKEEDIKDKSIKEFFKNENFVFDNPKFDLTQNINVIYNKGDKIYLEFSSISVSGRRIFSGRNQTQNILHEKLIDDEKKKSDAMLASILPPSLVPRVQAGEKNISFSVQSVTVLFLDVVEFTPWCGSHEAAYVMRMLNIMFKEFDAITNAHKTMTKIKCIGDCYMAAGGIFDEVNQPAVHAKEVVDFGTLVIKKLLEIDENENENLRIRVGINTGGPIVAGVIGTEKPTFEILGPAINIAHEMENKGVPMKVHVSRPVYELIYGQQFDIKERGEIDVKGGKMFTYLIEP